MARTPFLGSAYQSRSKTLADQRLVNLYLETVETKEGHAPGGFLGCPGLTFWHGIGSGPSIRAMRVVEGLLYVISGNTAVRIEANGSGTNLGNIGTTTGQAYIVANQTQIGFFDSTGLWVWTPGGSSWANVTLPFSGAVGMPAYQDTLCLLTQPGTQTIWQCDSGDLTSWQSLNFTEEDGNNDNVVGLVAIHDQVIVFKVNSLCFYVNAGLNGFVYQRLAGIFPAIGAVTASAIVTVSDRVLFLGQTQDGGPRVYRIDGYQPVEVSTYAIDYQMTNFTVLDAFAFGYTQEGHSFYVLTFPTGNVTYVNDLKESDLMRFPVWHQRAGFNNGLLTAYTVSCAAQSGGVIYMGDNNSSNIYTADLNSFLDNGQPRKWLRSWRAQAEAAYATEKCNYLNIQCQTGVQVPVGTNPQVVLRQSFDDGNNWSAEQYAAIGMQGETMTNLNFPRLGSTRRGLNSDRVFELSSTDNFVPAFMGAEIA
jgi:hypothetical protein